MGFFDWLVGRQAPARDRGDQIAGGSYGIYRRKSGSDVRIVVFHTGSVGDTRPMGYDTGRRVLLRAGATRADGLPTKEALQRLDREEDALVDELVRCDVDCLKVGHVTTTGVRELVFQCADGRRFDEAFEVWQRPRPGIELQRAEGWSFFDDTLQPTAVDLDWILNARIVQSAIEAGSDRQLAIASSTSSWDHASGCWSCSPRSSETGWAITCGRGTRSS